MPVISDVFAFALQNADYWTEFLSGGDFPAELTDDEMRALAAARAHVEDEVVELLHACGQAVADKLGAAGLARPRPQPAVTARNRRIRLRPPIDLGDKLFGIEFSLDPDADGRTIQLYASLVVKKSALDTLQQSLAAMSVVHAVDHHHVYGDSLQIAQDDNVANLASLSADQVVTLLSGFRP